MAFKNFVDGTLGEAVATAVDDLSEVPDAFPEALTDGGAYKVTLDPQADAGDPEIIQINEDGSITRGVEGTVARDHASGVAYEHTVTAGDMAQVLEQVPGMKLLGESVLESTTGVITVQNIPATHRDLRAVLEVRRSSTGFGDGWLRFNGVSGAGYSWARHSVLSGTSGIGLDPQSSTSGGTAAPGVLLPDIGSSAGRFVIDVPGYSTSQSTHSMTWSGFSRIGTAAASNRFGTGGGIWVPGASVVVSSLRLSSVVGNFIPGSRLTVYGIGPL